MKPLTFPFVLAADAAIDLQLHTIYSDGTWTPEQLIDYLVSEQFGLAAITDHDRVDTTAELQQLAAEKRLPLLAAVEMSTSWKGEPTDVLCYGFDPEKNKLNDLARDVLRRQQENTQAIYENLRQQGLSFSHPDELAAILETPSAQQLNELIALLEMMRICWMNSARPFLSMASRSIIPLIRPNRLPCIWSMPGSIVCLPVRVQIPTAWIKNPSNIEQS